MKCDECGREFATDAALSQHLRDKHGLAAQEGRAEERKATRKPKSLRRRNRHPVAIGIAVVAVVVGLGLYAVVAPSFAQPPFPCGSEGTYDHLHPYLQIWVDGKNVTIPTDVGILQGGTCTEPVHTHDSGGVLHLELSQAQSGQNWTLSDFFRIWSFSCGQQASYCPVVNGTARPVEFTPTDILGFKADSSHRVVLLVDGAPSADYGSLNLMKYDYCNAAIGATFPCSTASGNPLWNGGSSYPYGTGHKIVIEYVGS